MSEPQGPATIVCYHGSPGLPDEFIPMEKYLARPTVRLTRIGYPKLSDSAVTELPGGRLLLVAYSFGALQALRDAVRESRRVSGVLLVSPYLYPRKKLGLAQRVLIQLPGLGDRILRKAGQKIVDDLLENTSHPSAVPGAYWTLAEKLAQPAVLRRAALEKTEAGPTAEECLRALNGLGIPLGLVIGTDDRTGPEAEQIAPLKQVARFELERRLERVGHAIPWTHPAELARIVAEFAERATAGGGR
jgi:pimeloyl-ACP methyl ester carboxylesterase